MRFSLVALCLLLVGCTHVAIVEPLPPRVTVRISKSSIADTNEVDYYLGTLQGWQIWSNNLCRCLYQTEIPPIHDKAYYYFDKLTPSQLYLADKMCLRIGYKTNLSKPPEYMNITNGTLEVSIKDHPTFFITSVTWGRSQ